MSHRAKSLLALLSVVAVSACQQADEAGNRIANENVTTTQGSTSASGGTSQAAAGQNIGAALRGAADHSTLVQAFKAAGLEQTLGGAGPYTVFAPGNAAFQKLPAGTAEGLMRPESKAALTDLLTYHVVPGVVTAKDMAVAIQRSGGKAQLATMAGETLTATQADGVIVITDGKGGHARVTQPDMAATNGIVHSVDAVLMPKG